MRDAFNQAQALLFGLALSDTLGSAPDFLTLPDIHAHYSDDTQMALALTEGLLDAGLDADLNAQLQAVDRRTSDNPESKRRDSTVRAMPLGYLYQHDEQRLREVARASSVISHKHPAAEAASLAAAYAVKLALDGARVAEYLPRIMAFTDGISDEFDAAIYRVGHAGAWTNEQAALDHIGQGGTCYETVALALYCVIRYPDDYTACVRRAANTKVGSASTACVAGGIMGARLGLDAIPAAWRDRCGNRASLRELAACMAQAAHS